VLESLASDAVDMAYPLAAPSASSGPSGGAKRATAYQDIFGRPQQPPPRVHQTPSPAPLQMTPYYGQQHPPYRPPPRPYQRQSYIAPQPGQPYFDPYYAAPPQPPFSAPYLPPAGQPPPPPPPAPPTGLPYYPPKPPSLHIQSDETSPISPNSHSPPPSFDAPPSPQSLLHDPGLQQYLTTGAVNGDELEAREPSPENNDAYWDGFQGQGGAADGKLRFFRTLLAFSLTFFHLIKEPFMMIRVTPRLLCIRVGRRSSLISRHFTAHPQPADTPTLENN
jgi:hypothetical protein